MDAKGPLVAFEVILNAIPLPKDKGNTRPALNASDLMAVKRDFAFVVDQGIEAEKVVKAAKGADKQLDLAMSRCSTSSPAVRSIRARCRSPSKSRIQPRERTLTDEEIEALSKKIVAQVHKATGGVLRS